MKGYKAFNKGLICRDKQYAENTIFEEDKAIVCEKGMHFCKDPLSVLDYYPLVNNNGEMSEFAEVEALDEPKTDDNQKFCTKKLKIGAKISFAKLVQASVNFEFGKTSETEVENSRKDYDKIGGLDDCAIIGSSGCCAQIGSLGDYAHIGSSGKNSVIMCAGAGSIAKGKIGSWITLSEWEIINEEYTPICVKTEKIDGVKIKEDTFYELVNGKFKEQK